MKLCKHCGDDIVDRSSTAEYCCSTCQQEASFEKYRKLNPGKGNLSPGIAGGRNELKACTDLIEKGYEIFRNVCQCGSCDLIALKKGRLLKVEVASGTLSENGNINCSMHDPDNYDIIAAVTHDKICYKNGEGNEIELREVNESLKSGRIEK